jgi:hypothetical protein
VKQQIESLDQHHQHHSSQSALHILTTTHNG